MNDAHLLAVLLDRCHATLKIVAAGIWRRKDMNACGLSGGAVAVHAVEERLKEIHDYIEGK